MKKYLLVANLILFSSAIYSQATDTAILDLYVNGAWVHNTRNISAYDASCSLASVKSQVWDAVARSWVNQNLTTYTPGIILTKSWDAGTQTWVNFSRTTRVYGNNGLTQATTGENWDPTSQAWVGNYRLLTAFNTAGYGTSEELDLFINNQWEKMSKTSIDYDQKNRPVVVVSRIWMNDQWTNSSRKVNSYSYNTKGESINYYWNAMEERWVKTDRSFNEYIPGTAFNLKSLGQLSTGENWQNNYRQTNTYTAEQKFEASKFEIWDVGLSSWSKLVRNQQQYFSNGQPSENILQVWDNISGAWINSVRYTQTGYNCPVQVSMAPVARIDNVRGYINSSMIHPGFLQRNGDKVFSINTTESGEGKTIFDISIPVKSGNSTFNMQLIHAVARQSAITGVQTQVDTVKESGPFATVIGTNPARHYVQVSVNSNNAIFSLYDVSGKLVKQQQLQQGMQKVQLANLQKGVYMVTISGGQDILRSKLLVE